MSASRTPTPELKGPMVTDASLSAPSTAALGGAATAPPLEAGQARTKRARTISNSMSVPDFLRPNSVFGARFSKWAGKHLNFFVSRRGEPRS